MKKNKNRYRAFLKVSVITLGMATLPGLLPKAHAVFQCKGVHGMAPAHMLSTLKLSTEDLVPFEDVYSNVFGPGMAKAGEYIRRPTASELEAAFRKGQFPDTPAVRSALFVVQKGKLDYAKPGELRIAVGSYSPKKWNEKLDFAKLERKMKSQLEAGQIANEISLSQYKDALSNIQGTATNVGGNKADRILLITLKDGTRGVFKAMSLEQAVAEVAAYLFAKGLGMKLVPPTVIAHHQGQIGSFQYFIENPSTGLNKEHGNDRETLISQEDRTNMELFYIMSGNWDAHPGNRIVDIQGGLGLIDNEAITRPQFYRYGQVPWFALMQKGKTNKEDFVTPVSDAFPFAEARFYNKPSVEDLLKIPGMEGFNPELLQSKLAWYQQDSGRIGVIYWQNTLWMQLNIPEYYNPRVPSYFPERTLQAASQMTMSDLQAIFQEPFRDVGGENIFNDVDLKRIKARMEEVVRASHSTRTR